MKKIILIFSLTLISVMSFGQNVTCISEPSAKMFNQNNFTNRFHTVQDNGMPMVLNVKFHGVHETDGSDIHNINEERFLKIIASLNLNFNQFNIFFKYRGYGIINNSSYVNSGSTTTLVNIATQQGDYDQSSINVFINNGGLYGGTNNILLTTQVPDANASNGISPFYDYLANYNMGRTLGLLNINVGALQSGTPVTNNIPACITNPTMSKAFFPVNSIYQPENVTRIVGVGFNADIAGDMVTDTQACFQGYLNNFCSTPQFQNFVQHPEVVDNSTSPVMYNCTAVESHNFMQNHWAVGVPNSFTAGQGARMRQYIISNPADFNPFLNLLADGITSDTTVLFEPYSAHIVSGDIVKTEDLGNGTANVCRAWLMEHKFQPGFDYTFTDNSTPDPITVGKYDFPVPPVRLHTFDYPVTIAQLDPTISFAPSDTGLAHISCTKGLNCTIEPFIGGILISSPDLLSTNPTIEQLDEIRAKDPELFEKLYSNYYYKLKKETATGAKVEKVFYKQ